uniref:Lipid-binding serum glycoprotein N-terminal domain-containing protein n=1 Tax=Equus caballus TaxID=9796 RepID=A0A3Q2HJ83_HORSE
MNKILRPSPLNQTLPSPLNEILPSPLNHTLPSTLNQTLPSMLNETLPSLLNETPPSPLNHTLHSPLNQTLPSPLNLTLPSPLKQTLPSPLNQTLPSPLNQTDGLLSEGLLGRLKKLPLSSTLKAEGVTSRAVFGGLLGKIATVIPFVNIIDVKITHPRLLDLDLLKSPDGSRFYVTIPLDMILNVNVPLVGSLLKGGVKLNITAELLTAQGEQKNIPLVLDSCTHSAGSLKITLLNSSLDTTLVEATAGKPSLLHRRSSDFPEGALSLHTVGC